MKLSQEELKEYRDISIHKILGVPNNGRRISMRCPFHSEKTPSFVLYPDNSFHCYGQCNKGGSGAIDFCVGLGLTFNQAVSELARYK